MPADPGAVAPGDTAQQVLLIGGRSGVGKTSVGWEVSELLQAVGVWHCLVDGDNLDAAHPKPAGDPHGTALTEANLRALWANYAAAGHHRLVYINTVSVLEAPMVVRAMGGRSRASGVLLGASDSVTARRLAGREIGSALERHLQRSAVMAAHLEIEAEPWVVRITTDARTVRQVAADVVAATGWCPRGQISPSGSSPQAAWRRCRTGA